MITLSIFSYFCGYQMGGIGYAAVKPVMLDTYLEDSKYTLVATVDAEETPADEVVKMATDAIDKEIIDLQVQITRKEEKKKQLLAIEHKESV